MSPAGDPPLCKCHGAPKVWNKDSRLKSGGYWRCFARHRRYREANREKVRENNRRYREANREKVAETQRRYREANREKVAERLRRWREANPEKVASSNARRMMVSGMYLGTCGFTESEIKEMISGTTD